MRSSRKSQSSLSPWIFGLFVLVVAGAGGALLLLDDGSGTGDRGAPVIDVAEDEVLPVADVQPMTGPVGEATRLTAEQPSRIESQTPVAVIEPDTPTADVGGVVLDQQGRAVAGAQVRIYEGSPLTNLQLARKLLPPQAVSGGDGRFLLQGVPVGKNYVLVGEHDDFARSELPGIKVSRDGPVAELKLVMLQGATVSGLVTTLGDNPIPEARVELYDTVADAQRKPAERQPWKVVFTDPMGRFAFAHVSTPSIKVRVSASGFESQSQMLSSALQATPKDQDLQFRLDQGDVLAGQVVDIDSGKPVAGVRVEAHALKKEYQGNALAFSGEDGRFLLDGLSREYGYQLRAEAAGYSVRTLPNVHVSDGNVLVDMTPRGAVEGWVVDAAGNPVTSFQIVLMRARPGAEPSLMGKPRSFNDAKGHFVFDDLEPGHYAFEARAPDFAASRSDAIQLTRGGGAMPAVRISMMKGGTLRGIVLDADQQPVVRALVEVKPNNFVDTPILEIFNQLAPSHEVNYRVRSNDKGRFQIKNIPAGTYQISIKHGDHAPLIRNDVLIQDEALGPTPEMTLYMPVPASVAGHCFDANRQPLAYTQVQINQSNGYADSVTTDANGFFLFENLRGGTYHIQLNPERLNDKPVAPLMRLVHATKSRREITLREGQAMTGLEIYLSDQ